MSARDFLNRNSVPIGVAVVIVAAVALWFSISRNFTGGGALPTAKYFTTDDGQTYFAGGQLDIAPFTKDGKEAVRAHVFDCNGEVFVGYLERFNKQSRPIMEELVRANKEKRPPGNVGAMAAAGQNGTEIKKPGDKEWISGAPGPRSIAMKDVKCKDGSHAITKNQ